mmetsp:Transcript_6163/g.10720  ORF Transcript_6163/g.10720 Transcript_6163/m.10720 type:complete len:260 (-) Transcript_6163:1031-1810(-)
MATFVSATSLVATSTSSVRVSIVEVRLAISASKSSFSWFLAYVAFSFSSNSLMQKAFSSASSCCSFFKSATILSIISLTLVKLSSCAVTARVESWDLGLSTGATELACRLRQESAREERKSSSPKTGSEAALRNAVTTRERRMASDADEEPDSCKKEGTDLTKRSLASSAVRMDRASETAANSSDRVLLRASHCESKSWHWSFKLRRNSTSAARCFLVRSRSSLSSERALETEACSVSSSSSFSLLASMNAVWLASSSS